MNNIISILDKLHKSHSLSTAEYETLIIGMNDEVREYAAKLAIEERKKYYGNDVYVRGLVEISNCCKNDCYYCGIRKSNNNCSRYTLSDEEILECCNEGYKLGFRTFVLQSGEGAMSVERICSLVKSIKERYGDCAITLSLGEYEREDYEKMYRFGADRYLLRHETADKEHYKKLHPKAMSFDNRMRCLKDLREIGFTVGCGFMVGSPYQTPSTLSKDLKFIEEFSPEMCGIGPFIPQKDTPFNKSVQGDTKLTLYLLSIIRLIKPNILLPATTALGTVDAKGRELGILSGANVVMPNLSPVAVRKKYALYDNKICTGEESAQCKNCLSGRMNSIGYKVVTSRGDPKSI